METHTHQKGNSFPTIVTLFLFLLTIAVTGYFHVREKALQNTIQESQESLEKQQKNLFNATNGLEYKDFKNAFYALDRAKEQRTQWSNIVGRILAYETKNIQFNRFSSTNDQKILISGEARTLSDVTGLLTLLKKNKKTVSAPFLNSMSKDTSPEGLPLYKFELHFDSLQS